MAQNVPSGTGATRTRSVQRSQGSLSGSLAAGLGVPLGLTQAQNLANKYGGTVVKNNQGHLSVNAGGLFQSAMRGYSAPQLSTPAAQFDAEGKVSLIDPNSFSTVQNPFIGTQPGVDWKWTSYGKIPEIQQNDLGIGDIDASGDFGLPAQVAAIKQRIDLDTAARVAAAREQEIARGMALSGIGIAAETNEQRQGDVLKAETEGNAAAEAGRLRATAAIEQAKNRVAIAQANQAASVEAAKQARDAEAIMNELELQAEISRGELKMQFIEAANKYRAMADDLNLRARTANQNAEAQMMEAARLYAQHRETLDLTRQTSQGELGLGYAELNSANANEAARIKATAEGSGSSGMTFEQRLALANVNQGGANNRAALNAGVTLAGKQPWYNMSTGESYTDAAMKAYQSLYGSMPQGVISTGATSAAPQSGGANYFSLLSSSNRALSVDPAALSGIALGGSNVYTWPDGTTTPVTD